MAKTTSLQSEMKLLTQYLLSLSPEDSKRQLLFPFFRKIYGDAFKTESDARGADGYVEGVFILEAKTDFSDWLEGFYQALHYHKRYGLAYQLSRFSDPFFRTDPDPEVCRNPKPA